MSLVSLEIDPDSKVTADDVRAQTKKIGINVNEADISDFQIMLSALDKSAKKLEAMPDFFQPTDLERFPRENVHLATKEENVSNAWAYKYTIEDKKPELSKSRPLAGKTFCLKDCVQVSGVPQVLGTRAFKPWVPEADATVVTRILEAGAKIVGNATCEDQCSTTCSNSSAIGNIDNPYGKGHSAGGSSSGCAYLVSTDVVDMAIGADQGGSIRIPSAHCGLVGLKPTYGLVPYTGISQLETNIDHAGPMTKTVSDNAILLKVIAGQDGFDDRQNGAPMVEGVPDFYRDMLSSTVTGMKIGILKEALELPSITEEVKDKFSETIDKFKKLGVDVVEVSIPEHQYAGEIWMVGQRIAGLMNKMGTETGRMILGSTKYQKHTIPLTQEQFDNSPVNVRNNIINGLYLIENYPGLYTKSTNLCIKIRKAYTEALKHVDAIVMPTTPRIAPKHGIRSGTPIESIKNTIGLNCNTGIFNMTGHPALSLPIGFVPSEEDPKIKFPAGFEIISQYFAEGKIYALAYAFEKNYNWKEL